MNNAHSPATLQRADKRFPSAASCNRSCLELSEEARLVSGAVVLMIQNVFKVTTLRTPEALYASVDAAFSAGTVLRYIRCCRQDVLLREAKTTDKAEFRRILA
jgi:hypothetical protein